jgi:hypothetical protein
MELAYQIFIVFGEACVNARFILKLFSKGFNNKLSIF